MLIILTVNLAENHFLFLLTNYSRLKGMLQLQSLRKRTAVYIFTPPPHLKCFCLFIFLWFLTILKFFYRF